MNDPYREGKARSEAVVLGELCEEIWSGSLAGFLRVLGQVSRKREPVDTEDEWSGLLMRRIREARRYRDIMERLGWGGLVFMNTWFKRTWLTTATFDEWRIILNVLEEGRSWFCQEIARVFGNTAPRLLETLTGKQLR